MTLRLVVLVGPTACGKTRLGVALAHRFGSEIVSADSRQVYRGLDIGTGKDLAEYAAVSPPVPQHLIDVADPREIYTLFHYQRDCYAALRRAAADPRFAEGARPLFLVGGTGLYVEAVLGEYRIANVPEDPDFREAAMRETLPVLDERLRRCDPQRWEETDRSSKKRVVRALEIADFATRQPLEMSAPRGVALETQIFCVQLAREEIHRRIAARLDARLAEGLVEEVAGLLEQGVSRERLDLLGLEYREVAAHLAGERDLAAMRARLEREIRKLAKRQMTWFRGMERRGHPCHFVHPDDVETVAALIEKGC